MRMSQPGPFAIQCARLGEGESGGSTARPCLQPDTDDEFAVQSPVRWARRGGKGEKLESIATRQESEVSG